MELTMRTESPSIFLDKREEEGTSADILDNSYWACSKFKFFCDFNQTVTVASTVFVSKYKCWRERTGSFSPFCICVSSGIRSSIGTISPWESKLAMFQSKEDKKLTVLFENKAKNVETQRHTKRIKIHQLQTKNYDFLFPKRFAKK